MRLARLLAVFAVLAALPARAEDDDEKPLPTHGTHAVEAGGPAAGGALPIEAGVALGSAPAAGEGRVSKPRETLPIILRPPANAAPGTYQVTGLDGPLNIQGVATWNANSGPTPGTSCRPRPPRDISIGARIHNNPQPGKYIIDSTPKTSDREFCAAVGFGGRNSCPLGPEMSPERISCELHMMGVDPATGQGGPHWMFVGAGTIKRHNTNPFLGVVHLSGAGGGTAYVCTNRQPIVCATVKVP